MGKFNIAIAKFVIKLLFKSSERYTVELKKDSKNYLLIKDIKKNILLCQEWQQDKYSKDVEINVSEIKDLNLEITAYNGDEKISYNKLRVFIVDSLKRSVLKRIEKIIALAKTLFAMVKKFIKKLNLEKFFKTSLENKARYKTDGLKLLNKIDFKKIKSVIISVVKSAYKKVRQLIRNDRYEVIKFITSKSMKENVYKIDIKDVSSVPAFNKHPERLKMLFTYFIETGELSETEKEGVYFVNGKAFETLDRLKQIEHLKSLNVILKIVVILMLLGLLV